MNNIGPELKLQISSPLGILYDDFIDNLIIKIHDGYVGINKNLISMIEPILTCKLKIIKLNGVEENFVISSGMMIVDKFSCKIYTQILIPFDEFNQNLDLVLQKRFKNIISSNNHSYELKLIQELKKLKE